jgi:hypothetical protein
MSRKEVVVVVEVVGNISKGMRCSYNENFKIMVIKYAEQNPSIGTRKC